MSSYINTMTETEFDNKVKTLLREVEGVRTSVYADTEAIPTIGIGYALITESGGIYSVRSESEIEADFTFNGSSPDISIADMTLLGQIANDLNGVNGGNKDDARAKISNLTFTIDEDQAENALNVVLPRKKTLLQTRLNNFDSGLYDHYANTNIGIALLSLEYNNGNALIGNNLKTALRNFRYTDEMSELYRAWYEIRYRSNGDELQGIANRRYAEADYIFDFENFNLTEYNEFQKFLNRPDPYNNLNTIGGSILEYEWLYPPDAEYDISPLLNRAVELRKAIMEAFGDKFDDGCETTGTITDPLILDLDGDGIETATLENGVYFDMDENGFAETMAWAGADDGLIADDLDDNGVIDDGGELVATFTDLAVYDTNSDNKIDTNDTDFADLKVLKGDGTVMTMSEAGIKSINLSYTTVDVTDANGNQQIADGSFTWNDDTTGDIGGFNLQTDVTDAIETEWLTVSTEIEALPDVRGFGTVYSLHQAMVRDTSGDLQDLIDDFIAATTPSTREALMDDILFTWAGATGVSPTSRGSYVDGQQLATLEQFMGRDFVGIEQTSTPNLEAGNFLTQAYRNLKGYVYGELISQSHYSDLFDLAEINFDTQTEELSIDLSAVITELDSRIAADAAAGKEDVVEFAKAIKGLALEETTNFIEYYDHFVGEYSDLGWEIDKIGKNEFYIQSSSPEMFETAAQDDAIQGADGNDFIKTYRGDDVIYSGLGNDTISACNGNDLLNGGEGADDLRGWSGNDTIYGGNGNDSLYGIKDNDLLIGGAGNDILSDDYNSYYTGNGNDTLKGGTGNDLLYAGEGNDLYIYNKNDGNDYISEGGGNDTLKFTDLNFSEVKFSGQGDNLLVTVLENSEYISINQATSNQVIENFTFSDDFTLTRSGLKS